MVRTRLVTGAGTLISPQLHTPVAFPILGMGLPVLLPVVRIILFPSFLAFFLVDAIVRICLQFFSFPLGLSCLLASFASTVPLVLNPCVPGANPPAAGTAKSNRSHDLLPGLMNLLPKRKAQKEKIKKKKEENLGDKQQGEEKKKKMISYEHTGRIYTAENVGKKHADFGWKVKRWLQLQGV